MFRILRLCKSVISRYWVSQRMGKTSYCSKDSVGQCFFNKLIYILKGRLTDISLYISINYYIFYFTFLLSFVLQLIDILKKLS